MRKLIGLLTLLLCAVILLFGCSGKELSRSTAKKLLEKYNGDGKETGNLDSGFVVAGGMPSFGQFTGIEKQVTPDVYKVMEKEGLVQLKRMGEVMFGERFIVTFPEDIRKKYILSTENKETVKMNGQSYTKDISKVLLARSSVKEITGIRQDGKDTGAKARVEFIIHMEVTPFGKHMLPDFMQGPDINFIGKFEKYDDGWRIAKNGVMPVKVAQQMGEE